MKLLLIIFMKEIKDALRDRRTLMVALFSSLLGAPLMLLAISEFTLQMETQADKKIVVAVGMKNAPGLENYMLRQGYKIDVAPADYEAKSKSKEIDRPVLLIPADFEAKLARGEKTGVEMAFDTANKRADFGTRQLRNLVGGYAQEMGVMNLQMRGVSPELLRLVEVKERHLSETSERKASIVAGMLPMLLLTTIVLGGMYASIDTMAGERERGSLEPLMMNPVYGWQLAIGKWAAVATVNFGVVAFAVLSFFPSKLLIRNETILADFQFGVLDAAGFLFVLLPLAATVAAGLMATCLDCKSYKEAMSRCAIPSMLVPLVGMVPFFMPGREPAWFLWVPVLAQTQMLNQVLKGETLSVAAVGIALLVCIALIAACLAYVSGKMRRVVMT